MNVDEFVESVHGFERMTNVDKIRMLSWFLHAEGGKERFSAADIRHCFEQANLAPPANIHQQMSSMLTRKPPHFLRDGRGYRLEKRVRTALDKRLGRSEQTIVVDKLLADLPSRVGSVVEREFLDEALRCFRAGAYRAAIVMTWNLAFDHLRSYVFANHLAGFNASLAACFSGNRKLASLVVAKIEDFDELKEHEFILVAKACGAISGNRAKILTEKLSRRNIAAHPSRVMITKYQAEDFITDLVSNVVVAI